MQLQPIFRILFLRKFIVCSVPQEFFFFFKNIRKTENIIT